MNVIRPSYVIETPIDGEQILRDIERYARTCYKSEGKIGDLQKTKEFVGRLLHTNKHEGIVDHHVITVRFICDRGVSHELVRHRIAAYLQESTRYCDYSGNGITFILPCWLKDDQNSEEYLMWCEMMRTAEEHYVLLRRKGWKPEQARGVLPHFVKTEVVATLNLRSWRNFFRLRTAPNAHPQMRELSIPLLSEMKQRLPVIFDDL